MSDELLQRELGYYRAQLDELSGQVVRADSVVSRAKRELKQRRDALTLLSELQHSVSADMPPEEVFRRTLGVTVKLKMDRTVVLVAEAAGGGAGFRPVAWTGYDAAGAAGLAGKVVGFPERLRQAGASMLVTAASKPDDFAPVVRGELGLPYFVCAPIFSDGAVVAQLVAGRMREAKPFYPPLDEGDVSTLLSVAGFLGAALHNSALFARVRRMADSFAKFVPTEFLKFLNRADICDVRLGDQTAMGMTVLFSDIRSFTTISEKMTPGETFAFINEYLRYAGPVVRENRGFIDKYIGDAIMALFPESPADAVRAGIGLQRAVGAFNVAQAARGRPAIAVGAGLHYGQLMLGTIGFDHRMESTVIADAVNLASRVEGLTKYYGAGVLVTGDVLAGVGAEEFLSRRVDRVKVKGKEVGIDLYDVFEAEEEGGRGLKEATSGAYAEALARFWAGDFGGARVGFEGVLGVNPGDRAARVQVERCAQYQAEGAPAGWDGTVALDHK